MTPNRNLLAGITLISTLIVSCGGTDTSTDPAAVGLDEAATMDADLKGEAARDTSPADEAKDKSGERAFKRVASFTVCAQLNSSCDSAEQTAAEIVAASTDGKTLIYTNSPRKEIGFVDIADPTRPLPIGALAVGGEPTSVAVRARVPAHSKGTREGCASAPEYINCLVA